MLTTKEAAERIRKSASWLNQARCKGIGPTYLKVGAQVFYEPSDIEAWLAAQRRTAVHDFANDNSVAKAAA